MALTTRQANIKDLEAVDRIERRTFDPVKYHLTSRRQYRYLLTKGNAEIWLAEQDGTICGMTVLFFRRNSAYGRYYSLAVDPDFQGGAVGKTLFAKAEERIREKGLKGMLLEVRSDNEVLLERYRKLGYKITYSVPDYYPDRMSCTKLKKDFV